MNSKNKPVMTAAERQHVQRIKALPCSVCDMPGPSECHEIKQGDWWTSMALCESCHRGPVMGWHGQKRAWTVQKLDEVSALSRTIRRLIGG